jgi:hypothetical protein
VTFVRVHALALVAVAISDQVQFVRLHALALVAVAILDQVQFVRVPALAHAAAAALGSRLPGCSAIESAYDQGLRLLTVLSLQEAAIVAIWASLLRLPPPP